MSVPHIYYTDAIQVQYEKILMYGLAGSGKTPMAATFPDTLVISSEPGLRSLSAWKIPYIQARDYAQTMDVIKWLKSSSEPRKFKMFFLDSISELNENILTSEKKKTSDARKYSPETMAKTMEIVREFIAIDGKHIVITCKATKNENTPPGFPIEPFTSGSSRLGSALPYLFDNVLYIARGTNSTTGQEYAYFTCRSNELCNARNRGGLLELYEPANLLHIIRKNNGAV